MMHTLDDRTLATPTVRVVFDGPPFAGKTTAAHALSDVLGRSVVTPDEDDGRTLWFDWMAYDAGHHGGQPVRVELVTVPGQQELAERRRHLLGWGDVVVFVANTSQAVFNDSIQSFRELRRELASRPDTPVVVIANKRDLIDAVPMPQVIAQLELTANETVIEGIALNGGGIREAFVHAVHAALAQPARRSVASSADELLDELHRAATSPVDPVAETAAAPSATMEAAPAAAAAAALAVETPAPIAAVATAPAAPTTPTIAVSDPRLNADAIADGDAVVILAEHWRMLVDVAQNPGPLPKTDDPAEAVVVAELIAWGLLTDDATALPSVLDGTSRF